MAARLPEDLEVPMRRLVAALALLTLIGSTAFAGGVHGQIQGPDAAGRYMLRAAACSADQTFEPWGMAEGVVDGKPQTVLLHFRPTAEHGVYTFEREWPQDGIWALRLNLGAPPAPATVATLRSDGTIVRSQLFWKSDGSQECVRALRGMGWKPKKGDGC